MRSWGDWLPALGSVGVWRGRGSRPETTTYVQHDLGCGSGADLREARALQEMREQRSRYAKSAAYKKKLQLSDIKKKTLDATRK